VKRQKSVKVRADNPTIVNPRVQCYMCPVETFDYRLVKYHGKLHYMCLGCAMQHTINGGSST